VLGFLSVSTSRSFLTTRSSVCFNPVLGFLSVSTFANYREMNEKDMFQSRAGFSECLDVAEFVCI